MVESEKANENIEYDFEIPGRSLENSFPPNFPKIKPFVHRNLGDVRFSELPGYYTKVEDFKSPIYKKFSGFLDQLAKGHSGIRGFIVQAMEKLAFPIKTPGWTRQPFSVREFMESSASELSDYSLDKDERVVLRKIFRHATKQYPEAAN